MALYEDITNSGYGKFMDASSDFITGAIGDGVSMAGAITSREPRAIPSIDEVPVERPETALPSVADVMNSISNLDITDDSGLDKKMAPYFLRLFNAGIEEKDITLSLIGLGGPMGGDGDSITPSLKVPAYAEGTAYTNFMTDTKYNEKGGVMSTMVSTATYNPDYNNGKIYTTTENLYPDELGIGTFPNKWAVGNERNSILYKTLEGFRSGKIKTLISGFGTTADNGGNSIGYNGENDDPRYGESRGRNLLTLDAERNGGFYNVNGYNNPYCRVWTHHHQFAALGDTIRPFKGVWGNVGFHNWENFRLENYNLERMANDPAYEKNKEKDERYTNDGKWGWKYNNRGWEKTVLDGETGMVNIAPKYMGGKGSNLHTKDCMFSIENLAWKDYDPYMFEKSLSWEQRGPMGGRIMWFPPYDISFSESVSTNWNKNDFIGRGESVYSYANTTRTGTLSFLMVVDHPSVVDYALWGDVSEGINTEVHDTDLLRFFAGCDESVVLNAARPTPLTDEYFKPEEPGDENKKDDGMTPVPTPVQENEAIEFNFKVFFPNNYTGVWDINYYGVSPIDYLLHGDGSNFKMSGNTPVNVGDLESEIGYEKFDKSELKIGKGYEMWDSGISDGSKNFFKMDSVTYADTTKGNYEPTKSCYYREDGCDKRPGSKGTKQIGGYQVSGDESAEIDGKTQWMSYFTNLKNTPLSNTWGQIFWNDSEYKDSNGSMLNRKGPENGDSLPFYSVGCILNCENDSLESEIEELGLSDEIIEKLRKFHDVYNTDNGIFEGYNVNIKISGCASKDGQAKQRTIRDNRNDYLAYARAYTVRKWLENYITPEEGRIVYEDNGIEELERNNKNEKGEVNSKSSKETRYAVVIIKLTPKDETQKPVQNTGEEQSTEKAEEIKKPEVKGVARALNRRDTTKVNKIRYDQEYHFFKKLKASDPIVFDKLVEKLKYFDPAFHSMTPEGFNARLTFLHQCTRQGDTTTASDQNASSAGNLAFGRPPFCVLRLGDFYNQMIVINNVQLDYSVSDGIQWDMNQEGIGMQPLLCKVTLNFNFIGGGDMAGPVRRLQNAMSFNYYANASLYDNRADRPYYQWNEETGISEFIPNRSYAFTAKMFNSKDNDNSKTFVAGVDNVWEGSKWQKQLIEEEQRRQNEQALTEIRREKVKKQREEKLAKIDGIGLPNIPSAKDIIENNLYGNLGYNTWKEQEKARIIRENEEGE